MNNIMSFPYVKISQEERDKDFEKLKSLKFKTTDKLTLSVVGNKTSNYYFQPYRMKTKVGKWSPYDRWNDPEKKKKIIEVCHQIYKKRPDVLDTPACFRDAIRMSSNSINQFKPYVAVYVYQKFKPTRILDISAGWGDRLIAAISQDIDYIGIDSNKKLKVPYTNMIRDFKSKSEVKMIFKKSEDVDYSKLPIYDLIFTSPPYFDLEQYEGMTKYDDKEHFTNSYFIPSINNSWKYLKKGGIMALNMPEEMYKILLPILGKSKKIKMPIQNRFVYKDKTPRFEYIYWWKK